MIEIYLRTIHK